LSIKDILGKSISSNSFASLLQGNKSKGAKKHKAQYCGEEFFYKMWSCDIREMIRIFASMINFERDESLKNDAKPLISKTTQNKVMREAGSRFLNLLESAINPMEFLGTTYSDNLYGRHLIDIATCFQKMAVWELQNKTSKNVTKVNPKQARRIEITTEPEIPPDSIKQYYKGIIRYGIFLRDTRGKSAGKKVVPRLVLRGLLVPYFTLSFSKHDSIFMSWDEFCSMLETPNEFYVEWETKRKKTKNKKQNVTMEHPDML
jgi:hypothetical protein